jgi:hypothetical protein
MRFLNVFSGMAFDGKPGFGTDLERATGVGNFA